MIINVNIVFIVLRYIIVRYSFLQSSAKLHTEKTEKVCLQLQAEKLFKFIVDVSMKRACQQPYYIANTQTHTHTHTHTHKHTHTNKSIDSNVVSPNTIYVNAFKYTCLW